MVYEPEDRSFAAIIADGKYLESMIALRDYVAHELEGNRCKACQMSQLRTGDQTALVLRLQKIIEDIQAHQPPTSDGGEVRDDLNAIRARRAARAPTPPDSDGPRLGTANAPRRQGGRQPRFRSDRTS